MKQLLLLIQPVLDINAFAILHHELVFSMATFGFDNSFDPSGHTCNKVMTQFNRDLVPNLLGSAPKLMYPTCRLFKLAELLFEMGPETSKWIEVW